jgi:hypothetical protein
VKNSTSFFAGLKEHSPGFWLATAAVAVIAVVAIALPVMRGREMREIEASVSESSTVLLDALKNPSIFSGQPDDAHAELEADVKRLSMLHDKLVLADYHFAHSALLSALRYTDYTQRIGTKLLQVGAAEQASQAAVLQYDQSVAQLKQSSLANRVAMQASVNEMTPTVRNATDLAYQECALLDTLTSQFGIAQTMALQHLSTLGPDVLAAVGSIKPALTAASAHTAEVRNRFNPTMH